MDDDPELATLGAHLADNVRMQRELRGLTQQQLARLAAIPRSTIAHLETGAGNPTLAVLARLAGALRLSLEELLSPPRTRCELYPSGTLPVVTRGRGRQVEIRRLLPHAVEGMEIDRMQLPPRSAMTGVPHRPGTHEYLYCERGRIVLRVEGTRFELGTGDVAAFAGDQRHSYENPGSGEAIAFGVVTLRPVGR
jgi:transcriptional regulator with XRE-family HTH domain